MATRVYCDHCGCTISGKSANKFCFGPKIYYDVSADAYKQQLYLAQQQYSLAQGQYTPYVTTTGISVSGTYSSGGGGGCVPVTTTMPGNALNMAMPGTLGGASTPNIPTETIDLCDRCVTIWMDRVKKLCRASDPAAASAEA